MRKPLDSCLSRRLDHSNPPPRSAQTLRVHSRHLGGVPYSLLAPRRFLEVCSMPLQRRSSRELLRLGSCDEQTRKHITPVAGIRCHTFNILLQKACSNQFCAVYFRQRPYSVENTRSHPNSEVKQPKARSVLGWGTAWEVLRVLLAFCFCTY